MATTKKAALFEKKAPPVETPAEWAPGVPVESEAFGPAITALTELAEIDAKMKGVEMWAKKACEPLAVRAVEIRKEHALTWREIYDAHCAAVAERSPGAEIPKSVSLPGKRLQTVTTDASLTAEPLDTEGRKFWIENHRSALTVRIDLGQLEDALEAEDFAAAMEWVEFLAHFPGGVEMTPRLPDDFRVTRKGDIVNQDGEIKHWGEHSDWMGEEAPPKLPGLTTTPEQIRITPYSYPAAK